MSTPPDDRSPMAVASYWASQVITVSLEMVVPGLAGLWLDNQLGTYVLFATLGFAAGLTIAIWHLIRMTTPAKDGRSSDGADDATNDARNDER